MNNYSVQERDKVLPTKDRQHNRVPIICIPTLTPPVCDRSTASPPRGRCRREKGKGRLKSEILFVQVSPYEIAVFGSHYATDFSKGDFSMIGECGFHEISIAVRLEERAMRAVCIPQKNY